MSLPLTVGVWKKRAAGQGWGKVSEIQTWQDVSLEPRFNQPGPWSLQIPVGAQVFQLSKQHLLTFDFRGTRFTGTVEDFGASADEDGRPMFDVSGLDVLSWLSDALAWPTPAAAITAQTEVRYYATGAAEAVLRDLIAANMSTRLGYELALPASQGRGGTITVNASFTNVLETVQEKANLAGLGVRMNLVNTTSSTRAALTAEFYVPADKSMRVRLSHKVGALRSWKQSDQIPTATRVIVQAAREQQGTTVSSVDQATDIIRTTTAHPYRTGDVVVFTDGTPPAPLQAGVAYHAIRIDSNAIFGTTWSQGFSDAFKVALTRANASKGIAINLTSAGVAPIAVAAQTRQYRLVTDAAAETVWARKRELLVEGSGDDDTATLDETGQQALVEAGGQSGFDLETAEAEGMQYGTHYGLGDTVTVELLTGLSTTEQLGAVRITGSTDTGLKFQAVPGNPDAVNPMFGQAAILRSLKRQVGALQRKES